MGEAGRGIWSGDGVEGWSGGCRAGLTLAGRSDRFWL
jgi:hypothetical protein